MRLGNVGKYLENCIPRRAVGALADRSIIDPAQALEEREADITETAFLVTLHRVDQRFDNHPFWYLYASAYCSRICFRS